MSSSSSSHQTDVVQADQGVKLGVRVGPVHLHNIPRAGGLAAALHHTTCARVVRRGGAGPNKGGKWPAVRV